MMRNIAAISVLIILLLSVSCIKEPKTCATQDKTEVFVEELVTFQSCSEGADKYLWKVPEGATVVSGGEVCDDYLTLTFDGSGTYIVKLRARNMGGNLTCQDKGNGQNGDVYEMTIKVNPL